MLHRALKFAAKKHKKQDRDGTAPLPYLTHVVDVVNKLRYLGGVTDPELLAAGFLHDVLEETDATEDELREKFGDRVAALVIELTREEPAAEVASLLPPEELYTLRSQLLLDGIARMSPDAMTVKLADRLSNLEGARSTRSEEKLRLYEEQSRKILEIIPRETCPELWDRVDGMLKVTS